MVSVRLPDGSQRQFESAVTVAQVAASIGAGLAKAALAGKVDGKLVDTAYLIERDADLAIVTDKDADGLDIIRHSTAHLLAYAVKSLFPEAQVTIGPVIDNGFYYDFSYKRPFTPEDLQAIEKKMAELAKKDETVERKVIPRDEAVTYFKSIGEHYKAEIIERRNFKALAQRVVDSQRVRRQEKHFITKDLAALLEEAALDKYRFVRNAYLQRRQSLVYDGNPPPADGAMQCVIDGNARQHGTEAHHRIHRWWREGQLQLCANGWGHYSSGLSAL